MKYQVSLSFDCGSDIYISKNMVCDGNADCPDGLDESYSLCSQIQCEFKCANNQCTLKKYLCDGINQKHCINQTEVCDSVRNCIYGSDEWHSLCLHRECNQFRCGWNGACLDNNKVCDGINDCSDSSGKKKTVFHWLSFT